MRTRAHHRSPQMGLALVVPKEVHATVRVKEVPGGLTR